MHWLGGGPSTARKDQKRDWSVCKPAIVSAKYNKALSLSNLRLSAPSLRGSGVAGHKCRPGCGNTVPARTWPGTERKSAERGQRLNQRHSFWTLALLLASLRSGVGLSQQAVAETRTPGPRGAVIYFCPSKSYPHTSSCPEWAPGNARLATPWKDPIATSNT